MPKLLRRVGFLAAWVLFAPAAWADLSVSDARLRAPLPGQSTAVAYLQLTNSGSDDVYLVSASMGGAKAVEVHEHSHEGGMMRMRKVERLPIMARQSVRFESGGYHLMVFGLEELSNPLVLILHFSDNRQLQVPLRRESI